GSPRHILIALCVTVTVSYGALYYAFTVLSSDIAEQEGWSLTVLTAGFSVAILLNGLAAIPVGQMIQRRGPRGVMVAGAALGTIGLLGIAAAPSLPWFLAALALTGTAASGLFYPPAFAAITHWFGEQRLQAITALTLVAGFASTIFAPLVTQLSAVIGWRWTYVVLAAILLVTALPLHARVLTRPWHESADDAHDRPDREVLRSGRFILVATGGTLVTLSMYASLVGLVPLLTARGLSLQTAAWILGIGGAGQVLGRLFYPALDRRVTLHSRTTLVIMLVAVPTGLLALAPSLPAALLALSVVAGVGRGLFTLVMATLVTDVWGPQRYASLNGVLSAPLGLAGALGPVAGAVGASALGGYPAMFAALSIITIVGAALMYAALSRVT
ncbi:MFS transporter, partial [Nocardioides sp. NPDC057577]|uniref:MFS transporter n=1 Tax=Nocardioides sp. NPDC057577 TaxID=3346171 RepID=UPI00366BD6B6